MFVQKGCVCFWDVNRLDSDILNGEVLTQPNFDIGPFLRRRSPHGEKPLVVWVYCRETFLLTLMNLLLVVIMADASMSTTT